MSGKPESLWIRVWADVQELLRGMVDFRLVTGVDASTGKVRTVSADPEVPGECLLSRLRGPAVAPGDRVVAIRMPGGEYVILGAIAGPGE